MEPNKPKCRPHGGEIKTICTLCRQPMCLKCMGSHAERGCKGEVMDLPSYTSKCVIPRLEEMLKDFETKREKFEKPTKVFADALPGVRKNLCVLRGKTEKLLTDLNKAIDSLGGYYSDSQYVTIKAEFEQMLTELKIAAANDSAECILKAMESHKELQQDMSMAGAGDAELKLMEETSSAVTRLLTMEKEFTTLGECLQGLVATCQNIFKRKAILSPSVNPQLCLRMIVRYE